jgi:hypothetical protein
MEDKEIEGWMTKTELAWLAEQAKTHKLIVEVGSYLGRSTRVLCTNTEGVVYAIDDWKGVGDDRVNGDKFFYNQFLENTREFVATGRLIPIVQNHRTVNLDISPDMVFVDGSHETADVKDDILHWIDKMEPGALLCGHDADFVTVRQALSETIGVIQVIPNTQIWYFEVGTAPKVKDEDEIFVTIGVPNTGTIVMETCISLMNIVGASPFGTHTIMQRGCYVHENRIKIVEEAMRVKSTHLLFVDSDMWLPDGTLNKLLAHNKDIVGVNYNQRQLPLISTVKFAENEKIYAVQGLPTELFKCYALGTGCMLIKMSVFDKIDKPWFWFDNYEDDILGEDIWFCREAGRKGIEVWCDPTIDVKHIGTYTY